MLEASKPHSYTVRPCNIAFTKCKALCFDLESISQTSKHFSKFNLKNNIYKTAND